MNCFRARRASSWRSGEASGRSTSIATEASLGVTTIEASTGVTTIEASTGVTAPAEELEEEAKERSAVGRVGTEAETETETEAEAETGEGAGKNSEAEAVERVPRGGEREESLEGETS